MHNAAWVKLLQHIPATEQDKLMLVTTGGTEITIQCFLRIDPECLALRGRLSGSTDAGRIFFVPYSHIDYFGFQQPVKEAEFHERFGSLELLAPPSATVPVAAEPPVAPAVAAPTPPAEPAPPAPVAPAPAPSPRTPTTIKSTVLEKFRSRSFSNPGIQFRPPLDE
jgi:hypothetical protein